MDPVSHPGLAVRALRQLRDGWSIIGTTLLLFLILEMGYRGQAAIRDRLREVRESRIAWSQHPYAGQSWFLGRKDFNNGVVGALGIDSRLDPYRGHWSEPFSSPLFNIDSAGRRLTVQRQSESASRRRVFMFGGSTMFGYDMRDSFTIASSLAAQLEARGLSDSYVLNYGQPGFTITQEVNTLILELARGAVPDVVVFLDGYNDMNQGLRLGAPGRLVVAQQEQQLIALGRRGFWAELIGLGRHSELVSRLGAVATSPESSPKRKEPPEVICRSIGAYYGDMMRSVQALAHERGFHAVFLMQPTLEATRKPLTVWERSIPPLPDTPLIGPCTAIVDSVLRQSPDRGYHSLESIFDRDTSSVFLDQSGHITEAAGARVAAQAADLVEPFLRR